jgi:DNA-binding SARP family transcriptional activator
MDLYRGEFLEGFSVADSLAFEQWVLARREQLKRLAQQALFNLTEAYIHKDDLVSALPHAYR